MFNIKKDTLKATATAVKKVIDQNSQLSLNSIEVTVVEKLTMEQITQYIASISSDECRAIKNNVTEFSTIFIFNSIAPIITLMRTPEEIPVGSFVRELNQMHMERFIKKLMIENMGTLFTMEDYTELFPDEKPY